jgi:hypothetical protein
LLGTSLKQGAASGIPPAGGTSTGTHIHIARKFNGEWLPAAGIAGVLPFSLEGWIAHGSQVYLGTLTPQLRVCYRLCVLERRQLYPQRPGGGYPELETNQ